MKRMPMSMAASLFAAGLAMASWAAPAGAAVTVNFVQPENYGEFPFSPIDRERILKQMGEYFVHLEKSLPPGQDLKIDVLDFDLAGHIYPNARNGQDLRILRGGADWPRMQVRYTLSANGQVLASGEDRLSDMGYLDRINGYSDGDPLRFEKRMVDDWFRKKFVVGGKS